ncbi:hypothetical protein [Eubacterium oxidoreducens]|uniref:Uncharacterized protein n=1 Tax=Eubacterium oxidoreducens TaxID=1732 RepID=A0A1G6AH03_EUBOX|nr:hypothetical protein [Eubacterium oxidoreducens]SDB07393.1 hypothetical protein SAMN02910417_00547 [Eubacterium oxidoreducens]
MKHKMIKKISAVILTAALCIGLYPGGMLSAKADNSASYITDLQIMSGADAITKLEDAGYTAMSISLNPVSNAEESSLLYLGYKMGSADNAITDIRVGSGTSLSIDGCNYSKVSNLSLNQGTGGSNIYLYASRSLDAGEPIRGIAFQVIKSQDGFETDHKILSSDGSFVVRNAQDEVADFDEGISASEMYLKMYKGNIYKPYIDKVVAVKASDESAAAKKIASLGCNYYLGYAIEATDANVYLGYTRTDDKKKAIRSLIAAPGKKEIQVEEITYQKVSGGGNKALDGYSFYVTYDQDAGEPVMDLIAYGYGPENAQIKTKKEESKETKEDNSDKESTDESEKTTEQQEETKQEEVKESETKESDTSSDDENAQTQSQEVSSDESSQSEETKGESSEEETKETEDDVQPKTTKEDSSQEENENEVSQENTKINSSDAESDNENTKESADEETKEEDKTQAKEADSEEETIQEDEEQSTQDDEDTISYAPGIRVYKEISTKDYISQYYLKGGDVGAIQYLYDEKEYQSASNSDKVLWVSNIYCSDKDGNQFINNIGYVTSADSVKDAPFETLYSIDDKSTMTTASAISKNSSAIPIIVIAIIIAAVFGASGIVRKKAKG